MLCHTLTMLGLLLFIHFQSGVSSRVGLKHRDTQMHQRVQQRSNAASLVAPIDLVGLWMNSVGQIFDCKIVIDGPGKENSFCEALPNLDKEKLTVKDGKLVFGLNWVVEKIVQAGVAWRSLNDGFNGPKTLWWDRLPQDPATMLEGLRGRWYNDLGNTIRVIDQSVCFLSSGPESCFDLRAQQVGSHSYLHFNGFVLLDLVETKGALDDAQEGKRFQVHFRAMEGTRFASKGDVVWNEAPSLVGPWMSDEGQLIKCSKLTCTFYQGAMHPAGSGITIKDEGTKLTMVYYENSRSGESKHAFVSDSFVGSNVIFQHAKTGHKAIYVHWNRLPEDPAEFRAKILSKGPWISNDGEVIDMAKVQVVGALVLYNGLAAVDIFKSKMGTVVKWRALANPPEFGIISKTSYWHQDK